MELNAAGASYRATISNQCSATGLRSIEESRHAAERACDCAAVVRDSGATGGRSVEEVRLAAARAADRGPVVGDSGVTGGRSVVELREAAARAADCASVVGEGRATGGRSIEEVRRAATHTNRGTVVGEGGHAPCRCAVKEEYRSLITGPINSSHKILCDPGIVRDARAANRQNNRRIDRDREGTRAGVECDSGDRYVRGISTLVVLEAANVATSLEPLGNAALQLLLLFQKPSAGLRSQVALAANVVLRVETKSRATIARNNDVCAFLGEPRFGFICSSSIGARRGNMDVVKINGELVLGREKVQELTESSQKVALHLKTCCIALETSSINAEQFERCVSRAKDYETKIVQVATNIKEVKAAEEQQRPKLAKEKAEQAREAANEANQLHIKVSTWVLHHIGTPTPTKGR